MVKSDFHNKKGRSVFNSIEEYRLSFLIITLVLFLLYLYAITKPSVLFPGLEEKITPILIPFILLTALLYVPRNIIKQRISIHLTPNISLLLLLILVFISRLLLGMYYNVDLDEGQLVYDAHLQNLGYTPFIDFTTRSPILIDFLILAENIIGSYSIFNAKIVISILFTISALFFYLCSFELFGDKTSAFISTIIYSVLPYITFYSFVLHLAQSALPFFFAFLYFFIKYLKQSKRIDLVISAIIIALFYFVRQDALILLPLPLLFIYWKNKTYGITFKTIEDLLIFCFVCGLTFIINALPFILSLGLLQFDNVYGFQSLLSHTSTVIQTVSPSNNYIILSWLFWTLPIIYLAVRTGLAIICNLKLIISSFNRSNFLFPLIFLAALFSTIIFFGNGKTGSYDILKSNNLLIYLFSYTIFILLVEKYISNISTQIMTMAKSHIALLFIVLDLLVFFVIYILESVSLQPSYFLVPTASLFLVTITPFIYVMRIHFSKLDVVLLLIIAIIFLFVINFESFASQNHEREYSHQLLSQVSDNLDNLSDKSYNIFTADTTLVINSKKEIFPPITHHTIYNGVNCLDNYPTIKLPCLTDLPTVLDKNNVSVIVFGARTAVLFDSNPILNNYLQTNWTKYKLLTYNEIKVVILIRKQR